MYPFCPTVTRQATDTHRHIHTLTDTQTQTHIHRQTHKQTRARARVHTYLRTHAYTYNSIEILRQIQSRAFEMSVGKPFRLQVIILRLKLTVMKTAVELYICFVVKVNNFNTPTSCTKPTYLNLKAKFSSIS